MFASKTDTARVNLDHPNLPIHSYKEQILATVRDSPVSIIVAETGAGKSTQVIQYLLEDGYRPVETQPRRLAARTVASRISEELGVKLGATIGLRTSEERVDSNETRALVCTDGLAVVRELMNDAGERDVLVLDEVHEWNLNLEVLAAWAKSELAKGAKFKLVLMSATVDAQRLSEYFDNAPIITVPGRLFPVEVKAPEDSIAQSVRSLIEEGRNVLVFQPGKAEIEELISTLYRLNVNAEMLPLHGELTPSEQAKCFKRYPRPKVVVATNVAQTSITIEDIDAVVDSGMERRIEVVDGVEGLYLRPISLADAAQRRGRAGRTRPGIYSDFCPASMRREYPVPEIERVRLDMAVLRLAIAGFDMAKLEFFHQPPRAAIAESKRVLAALGCLREDGSVTKIGKAVAALPLSASIGRMVVEARSRGVLGDVITLAAILEVGGIVSSKNYAWQKLAGEEQDSDLLAQLSVFHAARDMRGDEFAQNGIFAKSYFRAKEITKNIRSHSLRGILTTSTGDRSEILKCICAGMVDNLYQHTGYGRLVDNTTARQLERSSVLSLQSKGEWLVGVPFDLEIKTRGGMQTINLVTLGTKVTPDMLREVAPQLITEVGGLAPVYNPVADRVQSTTQTLFNGTQVSEATVDDERHPQAAEIFARWIVEGMN